MAKFMKFKNTVLRNLFSKPATLKYPLEEREYPQRSRGHVSIDIEECIFCGMCARKCPSLAIEVDRKNSTWKINRMSCVQCANCVNHCPKACLQMKPGYTKPAENAVVDTYKQEIKQEDNTDIPENAKLVNDIESCVYCGLCQKTCPNDAISVERADKKWEFKEDACIKCGACVDKCPKKCLKFE